MRIAARPDMKVEYFTPDGRLTLEGQKLFLDWINAMREAKAELDDHETRIVALEP